ncbi:MAG TPA: cation diffusion facilitator family transporter [Stellaceae bacterium]|jgi:ferrous-iron efflux pump FieF|nr:cation diffusion facilitator family transporter [Stellaceae bacterium]
MATRTAVPLIYGPQADRLRRRATYASVAVALLLIAVKFAAWLETGSVALLSSVIDSLLDAAASIVNLLAVRHAMAPADREHRFGHGKAEPLAVLGQSAFITGSALLLLAEAARRLIRPAPVTNPRAGIAVMVFSIVVTVALVLYQRHVVRRTGSIAITADELHYRGDVILNGSVIAALVLSGLFGLRILDPLFGASIGIWIIWSAVRLARLSLIQLMDQELPDDEREKIREIAQSHPEVAAAHDLRTRVAGPTAFIQLHIEMDGEMSLIRAHEISDEVEASLRSAYPNAEIIIHQDPEGVEEPRANFPRRVAAR